MEFAPKFLIQIMSKLVEPDISDVLSTSTTVSSVFAVSLTKNLMCCKSVCVQAFARHTHMSETPTNSFYFMVALCNRADHIYFHAVSSFFFYFLA